MTGKSLFPPVRPLGLDIRIVLLIALCALLGRHDPASAAPGPAAESGGTEPPFKTIAAGGGTCAITQEGGVLCWGQGHPFPLPVSGLGSGVQAVAVGPTHACALTEVGGVKCWGRNNGGQLGDGGDIDRLLPRTVTGLESSVLALAAGGLHTCALNSGSGVSCWGGNFSGQLGDGTTEVKRLTPVPVSGLLGGVTAVAAGGQHTCALLSGAVKCWGANEGGQLGDGTTVNRNVPVDVAVGTSVQAVAASGGGTCALLSGGQVKCWGDYKTNSPAAVNLDSQAAVAIAGGGAHMCALTAAGGVKCWGDNTHGILGDGTLTDRLTPAPVLGLAGPVQAVTLAHDHTCALAHAADAAQPIVQCWGNNGYGQLGVNNGWLPVDVIAPDALHYLPYAGRG